MNSKTKKKWRLRHLFALLNKQFIVSALIGMFFQTSAVFAEIKEVNIEVEGLTCPFCISGLEQKLKAVDGVAQAEIDLKTGNTHITINDKTFTSVEDLNNAVRKAGFSSGKTTVTAKGIITKQHEQYFLNVSHSSLKILLTETRKSADKKGHESLAEIQKTNHTVLVSGIIDKGESNVFHLSVTSIQLLPENLTGAFGFENEK